MVTQLNALPIAAHCVDSITYDLLHRMFAPVKV